MGTVIENNSLSAILLELLLKNRPLALNIFNSLIKNDPRFLEELTPASTSTLAKESFIDPNVIEKGEPLLEKTEIDDTEIRILAKRQFAKYDAVFKALA